MATYDGTRDAVVLLTVLGLVAFIGLWGVGAAANDLGETATISTQVNQTAENGYVSVDDGDATRYSAATVTNETRELERGEFFWNQSDGTIQFNETVQSPDENVTYENVTVNTTSTTLPGQSATLFPILEPLMQLPAYVILIAGAAAMLIGLRELRDTTRGRGPI